MAVAKLDFFHLSTKIRGSNNSIDRISFNGQSLGNPLQIKEATAEFFSSSFQAVPTSIDEHLFYCSHPKVSHLQNSHLLANPDFDEIKHAVFSLGNLSAPSSNGLSGCFYTSC